MCGRNQGLRSLAFAVFTPNPLLGTFRRFKLNFFFFSR